MKVAVVSGASEEAGAVIVARTSRSPNTFDEISAEVAERGHEEFLEKNVLGYGHDSVAEGVQCPWVGIEDISDLAANVVATSDPQLRVQMTSTRYQDMSKRPLIGARDDDDTQHMRAMIARYVEATAVAQATLDKMDHVKKRTLTMDIARCFLPAGISTQLGIRGDARTMRDACAFMLGHELEEVRAIGGAVRDTLRTQIDKLFDRHLEPAPAREKTAKWPPPDGTNGRAYFTSPIDDAWCHRETLAELRAWRDSGWRRRMRITPQGPYWTATITSDYGAYRDLRRNRTIHQTDVLPSQHNAPQGDALWAFRDLYPDVCAALEKEFPRHPDGPYGDNFDCPYLAPFGTIVTWEAGGHVCNWAYGLRLRSYAEARNPRAACHPAYALPARHLMVQILEQAGAVARVMGIVESPKSLCGVEFSDRVP